MKIELDIKTFLSEEIDLLIKDIDFCYDSTSGAIKAERTHPQIQKVSARLRVLRKIVQSIKEEIKTEDNFKITL